MRIGKLLGIPIVVDGSCGLMMAFMTIVIGRGWVPQLYPGLTPQQQLHMAMLIVLSFFGCVVIHELVHGMVATRAGMSVTAIMLFALGGTSKMKPDMKKPWDEFKVAIVGPVTSIALGVMFLGIARYASTLREMEWLFGYALALAYMNTALGFFNLLPAYPLDGGRILKALFWHLTNKGIATAASAMSGTALGLGLMFLGILLTVHKSPIMGVWMGLVGYQLTIMAKMSFIAYHLKEQPVFMWLASDQHQPDFECHIKALLEAWPKAVIRRVSTAHHALDLIGLGQISYLIMSPCVTAGYCPSDRKELDATPSEMGLETLRRIRALGYRIPVIVYGLRDGNPDPGTMAKEFERLGANAFAHTPEAEELVSTVRGIHDQY